MAAARSLAVIMTAVWCTGWIVCGVAVAAPVEPGTAPISVLPGDSLGTSGRPPSVDVVVRDVGGPGRPGGGSTATRPGGGQGGEVACRWALAPDVEQFVRRLPAALSNGVGIGRVGRTGGSPQDKVDPAARLYQRVCNGVAGEYQWSAPAQSGQPAVVLPTPAELAQEAYSQVRLPLPTPEHSPDLMLADGRRAVLVGEHTWLWTDPARFRPQSRRVQVGPVWAQVTATPIGLTFEPGDGATPIVCSGPGTPFVSGRYAAHAASPTCDYQYSRSSTGAAGGVVSAEYGITWRVRWTGAAGVVPAGGQLPDMTSRAASSFAVAEAQALGVTD